MGDGDDNGAALDMAEKVIGSIPDSLTGADLSAVANGALRRALSRLCDEVDQQVKLLEDDACGGDVIATAAAAAATFTDNVNTAAAIDCLVSTWTERQLIPTVTADDIIESAKEISPSVDGNEIMRCEEVKRQFCG